MKKTFLSLLLSLAILVSVIPIGLLRAEDVTYDIYVSVNGSDTTGDGTAAKPYATIGKARDAARAKGGTAEAPVKVFVGAGKYFLSEPIRFTAEDSYVTYVGPGAVLTGAKTLSGLTWTAYRDGIMVADTETDLGIDQLFVNGEQQILARYPNYDPTKPLQGSTSQADIKARTAGWTDPAGGYIRALHKAKWGGNSYRITGKDNSALGLSYTWVGDNNRGSAMHTGNVLVENIFEELDSPGEWFYNGAEGKLYLYPGDGVELSGALIEGAVTEELLHAEGTTDGTQVKNLVFDGLTLENTKRTLFTGTYIPLMRSDWCVVRSGALYIKDAEDITFKNGTIRNIGGNGIFLSGHSANVLIDNNEILNIGSSGVLAAGYPDSCREPSFWEDNPTPDVTPYYVHKTTIDDTASGPIKEHYPRNATISNNHIQNVGIWEKQSSQVALSVAYQIKILHNTIHEGPRAGINNGDGTFGGHEIAYNDVFDVQRETDDHGMFNSWGRDRFWSLGGFDTGGNNGVAKEPYSRIDVIDPITIHDNRMHFGGRVDGGSTFGIDLDDGSSNYEIYNNLCLNMGIKLREGFHRKVYNNILVNGAFNLHCTFADSFDTIEKNIVVKGSPYALAATGESRFLASQDVINKNCFYDLGMQVNYPGYWKNLGFDTESVVLNPVFRDTATNDYTVTSEAVLNATGFENFSMTQFGKPGCPYQSPIYQKTHPDGSVDIYQREEWLGATISALDDAIMSSTGAGGLDGVYLETVPADSQAARYGLQERDVIKSVNRETIGEKSRFISLYDTIPQEEIVHFGIIRNQLAEEINYIRVDKPGILDDRSEAVSYAQASGVRWEYSAPDHNPNNARNCINKTMTYAAVNDETRKDAVVTAVFHGTKIDFYSRKSNNMGDYRIVVRKAATGEVVQEATVSAYINAKDVDAQLIFASEIFPEGDYVLELTCLTGSFLIVDAFKVTVPLTESSAAPVFAPVEIKADGVRMDALAAGKTAEIKLPVTNNGSADISLVVAAYLMGGEGLTRTELLQTATVEPASGDTENATLSVKIPDTAEGKRLSVVAYDPVTFRPYTYAFVRDGNNVAETAPALTAVGPAINVSYEAATCELSLAANGYRPGSPAMAAVMKDGELITLRQVFITPEGSAQVRVALPEDATGTLQVRITDSACTTKTVDIFIRGDENILNKAALRDIVGKAKVIIDNEEGYSEYELSTWEPFYDAYFDAASVLDDPQATQEEINAAAAALTEAMAGLKTAAAAGLVQYRPSPAQVNTDFVLYRKDGTVDGGNRDAHGGDQWQVRANQVDATVNGSYAEFRGLFKSFKIWGANKYDTADFKVLIIDPETQETDTRTISMTRDQNGTVLIFDAGELSGAEKIIRVMHNDNDGRYLELREIAYVLDSQTAPALQSVTMKTAPTKEEYIRYDLAPDLTGGILKETYEDGSEKEIPMIRSMCVSGFDTATPGEKTISLSHRGQTIEFGITVLDAKPLIITVKPTRLDYEVDGVLEIEGIKLAMKKDGKLTEVLASDCSFRYDFSQPGKARVVVSYETAEKEILRNIFTVTVNTPPAIRQIVLAAKPERLIYRFGESLALDGLKALVKYSDGTSALLSHTELTVSGYNPAKSGIQRLTVRCGSSELSTGFSVRVTE